MHCIEVVAAGRGRRTRAQQIPDSRMKQQAAAMASTARAAEVHPFKLVSNRPPRSTGAGKCFAQPGQSLFGQDKATPSANSVRWSSTKGFEVGVVVGVIQLQVGDQPQGWA